MENTDSYLLISGIQHYAFCPRQWALIHIEGLWGENALTVTGKHLHENIDNPRMKESRGDRIVTGSVPLVSHALHFQGIADVVEFWRIEASGVSLPGHKGLWMPVPVEYKRGKPKEGDCDAVQLCVQGLCLEEMLGVSISKGYLFYGQTRRREAVYFTQALRQRVFELSQHMWTLLEKGETPKAQYERRCENCSLINLCMPQLAACKKTVGCYVADLVKGTRL